jgi:7-cyano-7-deazaguanine synthase
MSHGTLVCLSGGLDSSLVLLDAMAHRPKPIKAVLFDYGQPHKVELDYAARLCRKLGAPFFQMRIDIPSSGLLDAVGPAGRILPTDNPVVHGRNVIMLAYAISEAMNRGMARVLIGATKEDHDTFPDCRREFIDAMDKASRAAGGPHIEAPLLRMTKTEVVAKVIELGLDPEDTWSCYYPVLHKGIKPCGKCLACEVRNKALREVANG